MEHLKYLDKEIDNALSSLTLLKKSQFQGNIDKLFSSVAKAVKNGNKIIFFGNGGSAADAQHFAAELVVKYNKDRKSIPSLSLSSDTSIITSVGNDYNFKYIFSRQIESLAKNKDVLIALSTSGNSKNIIEALKISKKMKLNIFCICGNNGGRAKKYTKNIVIIPNKITSTIQTCQKVIMHALCDYIENTTR